MSNSAPTDRKPYDRAAYLRSRREAGVCVGCHRPAPDGPSCEVCRAANRDRKRATYRRAKGIPLDAPLSNRGRPRKP